MKDFFKIATCLLLLGIFVALLYFLTDLKGGKQKVKLPAHDEVIEVPIAGKSIKINRHVPERELEIEKRNNK